MFNILAVASRARDLSKDSRKTIAVIVNTENKTIKFEEADKVEPTSTDIILGFAYGGYLDKDEMQLASINLSIEKGDES